MDTAWTTENLLKLLNAMKTNISDGDRMRAFLHGVKKLDWEKVAFPPFSPKDCQQKWRVVSHKMRKIRTLAELVDEAADGLSNRTKKRPKRPGPPRIIFYEENVCQYHEQHPELSREKLFKLIVDKYDALTEEEKAPYVEKYQRAHAQYKRKFSDTDMQEKEKWLSRDTSKGESETSLEESPQDTQPPKPPKQRGSMEGVPKRGYVSEWAQRWRDLTAGERNSFSLRCATVCTLTLSTRTLPIHLTQGPMHDPADEDGLRAEDEGISFELSTLRKRSRWPNQEGYKTLGFRGRRH